MIKYSGNIPDELWEVLEETLHSGLPLQGDYTRSNALLVALAASLGYITTIRVTGEEYGTRWYITGSGLAALEQRGNSV